jgi:hypothetical protein
MNLNKGLFMSIIENEVNSHKEVDWKVIKEILCGIAAALKIVCDMLPAGIIKQIICGMASFIEMLCNSLPG